MAIVKQVILSRFSRRVNWGTERVNDSCRATAADRGGLAKIHAHRGGFCTALLMMGLGYSQISDSRAFLTAGSLFSISAEYPGPKDLPPGSVSCLTPSLLHSFPGVTQEVHLGCPSRSLPHTGELGFAVGTAHPERGAQLGDGAPK